MGEKVQRNSTVDFFRGIACICVVFIHIQFPAPVGKWMECIAKFAVPFFFMTSGYFLDCESREVCERKIRRNICNIVRLSLVFVGIYLLNDLVRCAWGNAETNLSVREYLKNFISIFSIIKLLLFNVIPVTVPMGWYLFAVLYCNLIFYYLNRKDMFGRVYFWIPILYGGYYFIRLVLPEVFGILDNESNYMFARNWLFDGLPNMLLGHCIHRHRNMLKTMGNKRICCFYILYFSAMALMEQQILAGINRELDFYMPNIVASAMMLIWATLFPEMFQGAVLAQIGQKYSGIIYIIHGFIIGAVYTVLNAFGLRQINLVQWAAPIAVVLITLLCSVIWMRSAEVIKKRGARK